MNLCAYYDCSCDSHGLFDDKEIARTEGYLAHLNQYHVISIDVSGFVFVIDEWDAPIREAKEDTNAQTAYLNLLREWFKEEVKELCEKYGLSYEEAKSWYDGYEFSGVGAIYNPYSIMCAIRSQLTRIA